nr:aprataxin-like [Cherax quadricarinatus]
MAAATPSKRAASDTTTLQPAKKTHWSQGLLASMNDPDLVVESDERMVIIKDKYPKVKEALVKSAVEYGYHAIPSMSQLHLHMISQDFDSPCLKTKRHWNSFNTRYFLDSADVIRCLEERGMVVTMTPIAGEKLLDQPLKCHKCIYSPQNMPKLKQHLYKHINN